MEVKAYEKDEIMGDERARRVSESPIISSSEVKEKVVRRRFTESFKQRVLQKVAELRQEGGGKIGEYVRKEGLYYSTVQKWEKSIIANKSINNKISTKNQDLQKEVAALQKQLKKANKKLKKAEMIIEIQKKISVLMEKPENK